MMKWGEYFNNMLSSETDLAQLSISVDGGQTSVEIPALIRTSVEMLDMMINKQGKYNLFVFPERNQTFFFFTLAELFHSIVSGGLKSNYDPDEFSIGEKVKVGNAVVEFLGTTRLNNGTPGLKIGLADGLTITAPVSSFPVLQKADTNRPLSSSDKYYAESKKLLGEGSPDSGENADINFVESMKTHITSSIFAMTTLKGIREQISECRINGRKVTDMFYIGQADYNGNIMNISPGQMSGLPSIIFASELYSIQAAKNQHCPVHSILVDISNTDILYKQLDALDDLMQLNVPVTCLTDMTNFFDLSILEKRNFHIWRWDSGSLTDEVKCHPNLVSERAVNNCMQHSVENIDSDGDEISEAMQKLAGLKSENESPSSHIDLLFEKLNRLVFFAMRVVAPITESDTDRAWKTLEDCDRLLCEERAWLSEEAEQDYAEVIQLLRVVFSGKFCFQKIEALKKFLSGNSFPNVYLIISDGDDKKRTEQYWKSWCRKHGITTNIFVMTPSEYFASKCDWSNVTVVCGWIRRPLMQKILFCYHTSHYVVLLYDYEKKWSDLGSRIWKKALNGKSNREIMENISSGEVKTVMPELYIEEEPKPDTSQMEDELEEIELVIRRNKYRRYSGSGEHNEDADVSAIPVDFVGGKFALFGEGHSVITATSIITDDNDQIVNKLPGYLVIGDFVVIRESDRDLVRDLADLILKADGKEELRDLASTWKEAIRIELITGSEEDLLRKLHKAGCEKADGTLKNWIRDDDMIAPQSKDDLQCIADATGNETLQERLDEVDNAVREVKSAHVAAGKKLSEQLKKSLAVELKNWGGIDPYNFWEPITFNIDGIGNVEVLKIIDIGEEILTNAANTNKLISEE